MKKLKFELGGRPRTLDDMQLLQDSIFECLESMYVNRGAFIISGCTVTGNDISSGIVFIDGKIRPFLGASSVTFPVYIKSSAVQDEALRTHETGGSKPTQVWYLSEVSTVVPVSGEYISMSSTGGRTWYDAVAGEFVRMKGNQTIQGYKDFPGGIKAKGLDVYNELTSKAAASHTHPWSQITSQPVYANRWPSWAEVTSKPSTFAPSSHTHPWSQITGAPTQTTRWPSWAEVTSKPSTFAPSSHTHPWSQITGAPAQATRWPSWTEVTNKPSTFTPAAHNHDASNITSGVLSSSRIPTITKDKVDSTICKYYNWIGSDFNNATNEGVYAVNTADAHGPNDGYVGSAGTMTVYVAGATILQSVISYGFGGVIEVSVRQNIVGGWASWTKKML